MELPKDIKCIVFDFDGTIFHLDIDWDKLRQDLNLTKKDSPSIGQHIQRLNSARHADLDIFTKAELKAVGEKRLDQSIQNVLRLLILRGFRLAILTRNSRRAVEKVLSNSNLAIDFIVGREDVDLLKPDPEGLEVILNHFKLKPHQVVLVGDTFHDLEAAKARGLASVIVKNPKLDYSPKGADYYIDNLAMLKNIPS